MKSRTRKQNFFLVFFDSILEIRLQNIKRAVLDRAIFIISPPRSGSTFLFNCLREFEEICSFNKEADYIWWKYFPYENMDNPCDYVGIKQATECNIRKIREQIFQDAIAIYQKRHGKLKTLIRSMDRFSIRYLDKTISNCFHLDFIEKCFLQAQFIFLLRDPRATISSMIEGWPYKERFGKPQLTRVIRQRQSTVRHWSYPAPPGWERMLNDPLPVICAWSWKQHVEYALRFMERTHNDVFWVKYEELVKDPVGILKRLAKDLRLKFTDQVKEYAKMAPLSRTVVSKPELDKWRRRHYDEILSVLPTIRDTAKRVGYDVDS